jgi:hypothetical protein
MKRNILWKDIVLVATAFVSSTLSNPAEAFPTRDGGHANCLDCHSSPRNDAADVPAMFTAGPGDTVDLSVNVTDGSKKYSISLAGLGAVGLGGFTPDPDWVDHFSPDTFNDDPQWGGPFYALSDQDIEWTSEMQEIFTLTLAETTTLGTYDLVFTVAGKDGPLWRDVNPFQLKIVLEGDFDADGDVDGNDFLLWQRGGSPNPLNPMDLAEWEANYGTTSSTIAAAASIPEPSTLLLSLLGLSTLCITRRCRA